MSYLPARRSGKTNVPSAPVTVSRVRLVPAFFRTTVAPGSTPPPESVTVPEICPVSPCARASLITPLIATSSATPNTILQRRDITLHSSRRRRRAPIAILHAAPTRTGCPFHVCGAPETRAARSYAPVKHLSNNHPQNLRFSG